jgi:competence protein ComFC
MFLPKIKHSLLELKDDLLDFVYPQSCSICEKPLNRGEKEVCENCWETLASLPSPFCPYCKTFLEDEETALKHRCVYLSRPEDRKIFAVTSLGTFDDYYQKLIHRFKYDRKIPLGKRLAQSLGEIVAREKDFITCDLIIPVPLHRARQRERGFNQSQILAEGIAEVTNLPLMKDILKRKKNTQDQTYLNAQQRKENVRGAFVITQPDKIASKQVILVDDVITTGATLNECARMLLDAGATKIFAVTLAVVVD